MKSIKCESKNNNIRERERESLCESVAKRDELGFKTDINPKIWDQASKKRKLELQFIHTHLFL